MLRRRCCVAWTGTNLQTGEEVGIKLVRAPLSLVMTQRGTLLVTLSSAAKCIRHCYAVMLQWQWAV
jgi:hypothetical protein